MTPDGVHPHKPELMRTLVGAGFALLRSETKPTYFGALVERTEILGVRTRYAIAVAADRINAAAAANLSKWADREGAALVVVGAVDAPIPRASVLSYDQFVDRLGGPIFSLLPLEPAYGARLRTLGHNQVPDGMAGAADDLFEQYVHAGLQFIFRSRVVRYGQERRGEAVADGLAMAPSAPLLLYDAKAAKGGYAMSKEEERKFEDYVREFQDRYARTFGRLTAIVVISGSFADGRDALERRYRQLVASCGVPLSFMDAATMAEIVAMMVREPLFRLAVDWPIVFSEPIVRAGAVADELAARRRDRVGAGR